MKRNSKIFVAGHNGLVGSAILKRLSEFGFSNIITKNKAELDLCSQLSVNNFFEKNKPEFVFMCAGKVGGIKANNEDKASFIYDNSMMALNTIRSSYLHNVKKFLFLGSSCIYPKVSKIPIKEEYLLTSPLEETNDAYALAKIIGLKTCRFYKQQYGFNAISLMPTNLYGPNDNFDIETAHVLPAMIAKYFKAKNNKSPYVELWGDGTPLREFLFVEDLANASIFCMENYDGVDHINIGSGEEISIKDLSTKISKIIGYENVTKWISSMPNGTHRKLLDTTKINLLGWKPLTSLDDGLEKTINFYKNKFQK